MLLIASTGSRVGESTMSGTGLCSGKALSGNAADRDCEAGKNCSTGPGRGRLPHVSDRGGQWDFRAGAGYFAYEPWNEVSGQPRGELAGEGLRVLVGHRKMRRAPHRVERVQVIGQHPRLEEAQ